MKDDITKEVEKYYKSWQLAGISVGVIEDYKITQTLNFGKSSFEGSNLISSSSIYNTGSLAKEVVAFAIMQLFEKGKIKLNNPIVNYLPYFKIEDYRYKVITVKDLLTHRSGFPDNNLDFDYDKEKYHFKEIVESPLKSYIKGLAHIGIKLLSNPGEQFHYSNIGYNILGDLISVVSDLDFEEYVTKNIFIPAEMNNTNFYSLETFSETVRTSGHIRAPGITPLPYYAYKMDNAPCSALNSNILDMCNWMILNMNKGSFKGKELLKQSSYDNEIYYPSTNFSNDGLWQNYGYGWSTGEFNKEYSVIATGGNDGYSSAIIMLPDKGIGVTVLSNSEYAPTSLIAKSVVQILSNIEPDFDNRIPAYLPLGKMITELGFKKAIYEFKTIMEKYPSKYECSDWALDTLADNLMMVSKLDLALEIAEFNHHLYPKSELTNSRLGLIYEQKKDFKEAIKFFTNSKNINSKNSNLVNHLNILKNNVY